MKSARQLKKQQTRAERMQRKQEKLKEKQKKLEDEKKDDPNAKAFSAPPPALLSWVFSFFNGVQLTIKNIHIRYEDDYFNCHRPLSLGLTIDTINLNSAYDHWNFQTSNGMHFVRTPNNHVNKEFNIVKFRVYVNT